MRTLPLLENRKSGGDKVKDFLGEGDYQPTGQGEETLRTLGGIMALEGQTLSLIHILILTSNKFQLFILLLWDYFSLALCICLVLRFEFYPISIVQYIFGL